jgi:hypothetical protein
VVQVHFVFAVKTGRFEGDSSGVDSRKSCSSLRCLGWANVRKSSRRPTWTSLVVDLGRFGCIRGGGLVKLPNSSMRCVG